MQITLLPALLPSDGVVSVPAARQAFTPGSRVLATVLGPGLDGGTLLSFGGREVSTGGALPHPPGTTLQLEVVEGGRQPVLRLVSSTPVTQAGPDGAVAAPPDGPPVSAATYGMAGAVLAAQHDSDVRGAAFALVRWMPALVSAGVLTAAQAQALLDGLAPVALPKASSTTPDGAHSLEAAARAIAQRVAEGGLLLERRLADVVRHAGPGPRTLLANDLRSRLAEAAQLLAQAAPAHDGAREAVSRLQDALLAEQARSAAHLARDGVVDVRIPVQGEGQRAEMRLRMRIERDAGDADGDQGAAAWRQVRIDLVLESLGHVQVRLALTTSEVRTEFFVEDAAAADRLESGLADLGMSLEAAGFARVLSRVVVDPVRVCAPDQLPDLPAQHSILDARA